MILCIVPARVGSKRIPNKNLKPLCGTSPMRRAVNICKLLPDSQIVVTGDWCPYDELHESIYYHRRPESLATDSASMVDVVLDVLNGYSGDPVLLCQPTQPLRRISHLFDALRLLEKYDSVASVTETEPADKLYYLRADTGARLAPIAAGVERAQDARPTFRCDGTVYGFRRDWFREHKAFRAPTTQALIIPPDETAPLDTPLDWLLAELRLAHLHTH